MRTLSVALASGWLFVTASCFNQPVDNVACSPGDQDGVTGGNSTVFLSVSDSAFSVGGVTSNSSQPNITIQNNSTVTLTLTNTGSTPHGFVIDCIPSGLPAGCPATSCFPPESAVEALAPGESTTLVFKTPPMEGAYEFQSPVSGDTELGSSNQLVGLIGEFVLM